MVVGSKGGYERLFVVDMENTIAERDQIDRQMNEYENERRRASCGLQMSDWGWMVVVEKAKKFSGVSPDKPIFTPNCELVPESRRGRAKKKWGELSCKVSGSGDPNQQRQDARNPPRKANASCAAKVNQGNGGGRGQDDRLITSNQLLQYDDTTESEM